MTPKDTTDSNQRPLLENILKRISSIDHNVEEILDRLSDHFDDMQYRQDWANAEYGNGHPYNDNNSA